MRDSIRSEFTRQARAMGTASAFHAGAALDRLVQAVRSAPPARVLELACGPGIVAEAISPFVQEIVGIDATPEMIRLAQERFDRAGLSNGRFQPAWAESLPFAPGRFDQVIARLSFHHFPDLPSVLAEARRVLRSDGQLVVADVLSSDDPAQSAIHNALERQRDPTHVRMLSGTEMTGAIRSAGFALISQQTWTQERSFSEWAQIVSSPERTEPLRRALQSYARSGQRAGIDLREQAGELRFTHTWRLVVARPEAGQQDA
jgi:ubiquinone/menaquinone biosynthesis C-methylase UbiE